MSKEKNTWNFSTKTLNIPLFTSWSMSVLGTRSPSCTNPDTGEFRVLLRFSLQKSCSSNRSGACVPVTASRPVRVRVGLLSGGNFVQTAQIITVYVFTHLSFICDELFVMTPLRDLFPFTLS